MSPRWFRSAAPGANVAPVVAPGMARNKRARLWTASSFMSARLPVQHRPWLRLALLGASLAVVFAAPRVRAAADGAVKWTYSTAGASVIPGNILSSPSVAPDGTVYIATEVGASTDASPAGKLFAITPTGDPKWAQPFSTADWIDSAPAVAPDGTVYVGCWDGNLYAVNPDGTKKWACALGAYVSASPAIGPDGTIYIGTGNGNVYAVNPDGSVKWFFPTLYWIEASPAVAPDGTIYIGSDDNSFYALNPDGTEKWHYTVGNDIASSAAIAADGTVYVGSRDLNLYAFTPTGALKWSFQTTDMIDASPVLGADGTVYFATAGGRVFAVGADGRQLWEYPAAGQPALSSIYSTPAVRADGSLVFGTSDNAVYALNHDGTLRWKTAIGDWADSSPCVAPDGTIYIGCTDKQLYALSGSFPLTMTDWPQFLRNPRRTGVQPLGAAPGTTGRLLNLSVRTTAGSGGSTLIAGFNVGGSGNRTLLLRGVGPTLASFQVSGALSDPMLAYYPSQSTTPTLSNDDWGSSASAATTASTADAVYAFPLPNGSRDAALVGNFPAGAGAGSMWVTGKNGATGIALAEVYDAGGSASARLNNLSARSQVGTGAGVLIAGFVVDGGNRAVLVRALGPTLGRSPFNLPGTLAQPKLQVFAAHGTEQTLVAENTNWATASNAANITAASNAVYAYPLNASNADCAMLLTLPPGNYTAQVSGVGETTGVALVEVYEVP